MSSQLPRRHKPSPRRSWREKVWGSKVGLEEVLDLIQGKVNYSSFFNTFVQITCLCRFSPHCF
jgi:hypothetical protein